MSEELERLKPNDRQAERGLLGVVMRDETPDTFFAATGIVRAEDFYGHAHGVLWKVFTAMIETNTPMTPVTLGHYIAMKGLTEEVGGIGTIIELWSDAPSVVNAVHYATIIRDKAKLRRYLAAAIDLKAAAEYPGADPAEVASLADSSFHAITEDEQDEAADGEACVFAAMKQWDERAKTPLGETTGIATPWSKLNWLTCGLQPGELSILAARPSVGKTLVAGNIAARCGKDGNRFLFASLEQKKEELTDRWCAMLARVSLNTIRRGRFTNEEGMRLAQSTQIIRSWPMLVDHKPAQSATHILTMARRMQRRGGLKIAFVDYLGLMTNDTNYKEQRHWYGEVAARLKNGAKSLGIHVCMLAQLNRKDGNADAEPELHHLRESGNLEEHADLVMMLHKPNPNPDTDEELTELFVRKQRNGAQGKITLVHAKPFCEIKELAVSRQFGGDIE